MRSVQTMNSITSGTSGFIVPNSQRERDSYQRAQKQKKHRKLYKDNNSLWNTQTQRKIFPGQNRRRGRPPQVRKYQDNTEDIRNLRPPPVVRKPNHIPSSTMRPNPFKVQERDNRQDLDNETKQRLQDQSRSSKEKERSPSFSELVIQDQQQQIPVHVQTEEEKRKRKEMNARQRCYYHKRKERLNKLIYKIMNPKNEDSFIKVKPDLDGVGKEIGCFSIQVLFKVKSLKELSTVEYVMCNVEDPFFLQAAKYTIKIVRRDLALFALDSKDCSRYRTFVIRKIWRDYMFHKLNLPDTTLEKEWINLPIRLNPQDKDRYLSAGLPLPLARFSKQDQKRLFQNEDFKAYYREYIISNRFQKYMTDRNDKQMQKYQQDIQKIKRLETDLQSKMEQLKKTKAEPRCQKIIERYEYESRAILSKYL